MGFDFYVVSSLIWLYSKFGVVSFACKVFEESPQRNVVCYTSLITGYCSNGLVEEACQVFEGMPKRNDVSYSAMISGFVRNECFNEAVELFHELRRSDNVKPNRSVLVSVLSACGAVGAFEAANDVCSYLVANSLENELELGTALIDFYAKCGDIEKAEAKFRKMPKKDVTTWSAMILRLALNGKNEMELDVFEEMEKNGPRPNIEKEMSIVPKETVEVIAQSIGINNLSPDAALALAPDVEYRMREIMQEAIKCMHHSKRTILTTDDVDSSLNLRNVEPIYGFASGDPLRFKRALGHGDLFYIEDKDLDFKDVIEAPLPKAPLDTSVVCHWLAIEGVQPAIPENVPVEVIAAPLESKKPEKKVDDLPVDIRLPVKHVLSRELQLYFNKITELALSRSDSSLFKEALVSLATDSGLHPLIPYFTCFIEDEVSRGLSDFTLLFALMRVVWSLLQNPHIHIEPYLHQLMPPVVTCIVAKRLGNRIADNHWELRDFAANLVASVCKRFGHDYSSLQTRLTKTLIHAFLDPKRALTQHYGAIKGLTALGPQVVRLLILPNLETYLRLLEPQMLLEKQKNEMRRHEAWRVYGALLRAAGKSIYDRLKLFPSLPSPPAHAVWRTNAKVITTSPRNKRKASEELESQPSPKKLATDGPVVSPSNHSTPSGMVDETGNPSSAVDSEPGPSSPHHRQSPDKGDKVNTGKAEKAKGQSLKTSAVLNQAWKDDLNSGRLIVSLFGAFGEGILPFIPSPEMSLFL